MDRQPLQQRFPRRARYLAVGAAEIARESARYDRRMATNLPGRLVAADISGTPCGSFQRPDCRALPSTPPHRSSLRRLNQQPYLLLSLTSLFWAGNIVLGRYVASHVPPMTLSCVRWIGAFFTLLPFAWPHLARDWPALRARLPLLVVLSATGFAINNRAGLLGAAIHPGAECAADPVVGTAVRGVMVARVVRRAADLGAVRRHHHLASRRADHHPARGFRRAGERSGSTRAT